MDGKGIKVKVGKLVVLLVFFSLLSLSLTAACSKSVSPPAVPESPQTTDTQAAETPGDTEVVIPPEDTPRGAMPGRADGEMQVIVFDVGQADCILLKTETHAMLIDAGNIGQDELILNYLESNGVNKLDYIVATHPHADHIGAMGGVIRGVENVGAILMPDVTHTTKVFETLLDAIEEKEIPIDIANAGDEIVFGDARIQILAPNGDSYSDLNDFSIVLRVEFGNNAFLFTGDADKKSENEQLSSGLPLKADVLKVGHHGSRTSSSQNYLDAVTPKYAAISLGKDNPYGHPHSETMDRLAGMGPEIYRTDENGTVSFTTDGEIIDVSTER